MLTISVFVKCVNGRLCVNQPFILMEQLFELKPNSPKLITINKIFPLLLKGNRKEYEL